MKPRRAGAVIGWAVAAMLCCGLQAQVAADPPPWNVRLVGQAGGSCSAVEVDGRYAYLAEGGSLTVLDVSAPGGPVPIGRLSFGDFGIGDIQVQEGIAYLAGGSAAGEHGLQIVDITNPRLPDILAFFPTPEPAPGLYVADGLAYVVCAYLRGGFVIIDITDPSSPTLRGVHMEPDFITREVHVVNGRAYLAARDGLHIFDVTNPALPERLGLYEQRECNDVWVSAGLAYTGTELGLEIVDITSPTALSLRGKIWEYAVDGLSVSDGLVYVSFGVVDATDPSSPTLLATFSFPLPDKVAVSSGTAYLADKRQGLSIMDITTPSSPTLRATYDTLSDACDVYVRDRVAYVANGVRGLKTVDVSNPRSPTILGSLATSGRAYKVAVFGNRAYVINEFVDIQIIDVTTPALPVALGSYSADSAYDLTASGDYAYVASYDNGLQILDVSDPTSPTLRGSLETPSIALDVVVSGTLAFVADFLGLQIIDVEDPEYPFLRSSVGGMEISEVCVANDIAYLTGTWAGADFRCIDISDPDVPRLLGSYDLDWYEGEAVGLTASDGFAYVILDALRVLDVNDPTAPELCGYYPTRRSPFGSDVFVYDDLVYLADFAGLRIFQFSGGASASRSWPLYE